MNGPGTSTPPRAERLHPDHQLLHHPHPDYPHPDHLMTTALLPHTVRLGRVGPADPPGDVGTPDDAGTRGAAGTHGPEPLAEHLARLGGRPGGGPALVEALARAGLTGAGGGHVPVAVKWRTAAQATGPVTVAANGAESEPLAAKDGTLLRRRPHLVLDGLALAAETLGASRTVVWLHGDDDGAVRALRHAVDERRRAGLDDPVVEVVSGPCHYLAGEANAITRALSGGPALPTLRRSFVPSPGEPHTLVQNVETLARVALVARGLAATRTVLLTLLRPDGRDVVEVDRGVTLREVLGPAELLPPAHPASASAVLLGGFGGTWARWEAVADTWVDEPTLRASGLTLGAGIVAPLPPGACGLAETAAVARYLARMSARQCGPCHFGLPAVAETMTALASGSTRRRDLRRLAVDLDAVRGRGACRHPDGAVRLVASALDVFADDVAAHLAGRPCAGARVTTFPVPGDSR